MLLPVLRNIVPSDLPVVTYPDKSNVQLMNRVNSFLQDAINQTAPIAKYFKGGNEPLNVFNFLLNEIQYKADGYQQDILKPNALITLGTGDCKSMSLFSAGVLFNLGYDVKLRYAGYNSNHALNHVYVIANDTIVDPVYKIFNEQKPYKIKQDFKLKWK